MASSIAVQAQVIDIRQSGSLPEHLFVDTNVWYWFAYTRTSQAAQPPASYQTRDYPNFLKAMLTKNKPLYHSGLQLAELAHLIETTELEAYNYLRRKEGKEELFRKEFRHNLPSERGLVVFEVDGAWSQVKGVSTCIDCTVNKTMTAGALDRFSNQPLDGYDLFLVESLLRSGITTSVLTDDGDFATIPEITVYTANNGVIRAAKRAGTLIGP